MNEVHNQTTHESKKNAVIKTLAIIGFIAALVLGLWLAVTVVRYIPSAFSSLASLAESLNDKPKDELVITTEKNIVNSGETFKISWSEPTDEGTFSFSFACTDGVSALVRNSDGNIVDVACDTVLPLAQNTTAVDTIFTSEKNRFTDVRYMISFTPAGIADVRDTQTSVVTVVNTSITQSDERPDKNEPDNTSTSTPQSNDNQGSVSGGTTRTVPIVTTHFPVSDPNGFVDLKMTYLGIGSLNSNDAYTPRATLDNDLKGAVQFEVKNIGTKTSDRWKYAIELPTESGFTYQSGTQTALKPNERAIITLGFGDVGNARIERIKGEVTGGNDTRSGNNSFNTTVRITN